MKPLLFASVLAIGVFPGVSNAPAYGQETGSDLESVEKDVYALLAPIPGDSGLFYLKVTSKRGLPASIAVVKKEKDMSGYNYRAVGQSWTYWLDEHEDRTLVKGTLMPYLALFHGDGKETIRLLRRPNASTVVTDKSLRAAYLRENNMGPFADRGAATISIERALAQANKACGSSMKMEVIWKGFAAKNGVYEPGALAHLFFALVEICKDKDFAEAIGATALVRAESSAEGDLGVTSKGGVISVVFGPQAYNPKYQFSGLLKAAL